MPKSITVNSAEQTELPMTALATKFLKNQGMQPGDVQKLYQLGMLKYLPLPKSLLVDLQTELIQAFPDNPPPSRTLSGVYRLALALISNSHKHLEAFLAPREYYTPIHDQPHISGIDWLEEYQSAIPCERCFDPEVFQPEPEPRPRLIDRINPITEDAAQEYLDILKRNLSNVRYAAIFGRYFEELTITEIGRRYGCSCENIRSRHYAAIQQLRYRHPPTAQLRINIFGADTIGKAICEITPPRGQND